MDDYAKKLLLSDSLREQLVRDIISSLNLPKGSTGVDIGCGIGSNTLLLAEAVGKSGKMVGIDQSEGLLRYAKKRMSGVTEALPLSFRKGDINTRFADEDAFDWAWSMDCVGYAPGDGVSQVSEVARIVKPGGCIFILAWSSQQLLPGYPQLEARLNATSFGIAPFRNARGPGTHFLKAPGWLETAGIKDRKAQTFVGNIQAPLDEKQRNALASLFEMRWGRPESELSEDDHSEFIRLCNPASPDFILNTSDYYGFFTYTLFRGRVAGPRT